MHVEEEEKRPEVNDEFLPELKHTFQEDLALKNALDSKVTNMITVAGTITALLTAIGTFLITRTDIKVSTIFYKIGTPAVLVATAVAVLAIWFFIRSYTIRNYRYPVGHETFFDNGRIKNERVDLFLSYSKDKFSHILINEHLTSIKHNAESNISKAYNMKIGQYLFLGSISVIVTLLGIAIITTILGMNVLKPQ